MRRRLLAFAAVLAGLLPGQAMANDRDLRATTVPAALCTGYSPVHFTPGMGLNVSISTPPRVSALCALPLNNVDLGGTTNDNDMSSFTVVYKDTDGLGVRTGVNVILFEDGMPNGSSFPRQRCSWSSNRNGTGSTALTSAKVPCAVDLAPNWFYYFLVEVWVAGEPQDVPDAEFRGIYFP